MHRNEFGALVTEASDIGLPPGTWPERITVLGVEYRRITFARDREGDTIYTEYRSVSDINDVLHVFND